MKTHVRRYYFNGVYSIICFFLCLNIFLFSSVSLQAETDNSWLEDFKYIYKNTERNGKTYYYDKLNIFGYIGNGGTVKISSPVNLEGDDLPVYIEGYTFDENNGIKELFFDGSIRLYPHYVSNGEILGKTYMSWYIGDWFDNLDELRDAYLDDVEVIFFSDCSGQELCYLFKNHVKLENISMKNWNIENYDTLWGVFYGCSSLKRVDLTGWKTGKIQYIAQFFEGCSSLEEVYLNGWDLSNLYDEIAGGAMVSDDTYLTYSLFEDCVNLKKIGTPACINPEVSIKLPNPMRQHFEDGTWGDTVYYYLEDAPANSIIEVYSGLDEETSNKDSNNTLVEDDFLSKYGLSDKYVPSGYEDKSGSDMIIAGKNLSWNEVNGKSYWYENGIKQGTYYDPQGVIGDGSNRGREICDNEIKDAVGNGTWFWLDSCYDGAKAVGKEVWIPYIYQDEDKWTAEEKARIAYESDEGMGEIVLNAINNKSGKWVRYDENGRMLKGWVTIEGALAEKYPDQIGNRYYYDTRTGLMAKGYVIIDGVYHFFNAVSGVMEW